MSNLEQSALTKLDARGYTVLEALTDANLGTPQTLARPNAFVCVDGKTYWAKGQAQQGLVAELIAGRFAAKVAAGPMAQVIRVTRDVLPPDGSLNHLEGIVVGLEDLRDTENSKNLDQFIGQGRFRPGLIDPASRARVVVFQSWIGAKDAQVLVNLASGTVSTIDHGDVFGAVDALSEPTVIVANIPGVPSDVGKAKEHVIPAVEAIARISDGELLEAVSRVPSGDAWRSPVGRRLQIAVWLADRRDRLQGVMTRWLQS